MMRFFMILGIIFEINYLITANKTKENIGCFLFIIIQNSLKLISIILLKEQDKDGSNLKKGFI